ncbi:hemolysin III family protein [Candidatus Sumerlaeota bacterium]|nr:hemolysin III family protein [Candidatus Sumerlaeota bacterium]
MTTDSLSPRSERANTLTHAVGAALAIAALSVLVSLAALEGDPWRVVGFSLYGSTLVILYLASTLYHAVQRPRAKAALRVLDHASIYLLIAGTYTPFALVNLRGGWGWSLFGVIWGLAVLGILFKIFLTGQYAKLSVLIYIAMGWIVLIALRPTIVAVPAPGMWLLLAGGLAYTLGVTFYAWRSLPHGHAIWHLFVLAGSACHFVAVLFWCQ